MKKQKNNSLILIFIIVVILFILTLKLVSNQNSQSKLTENQEIAPSPDPTIKFDWEKIKVGDAVGSMSIAKISNNGTTIMFKGKTLVSGEIDESNENICMFNFDGKSLSKMPKISVDTRDVWFCFDNSEFAKNKLSKMTSATVLIDDYTINYYRSEIPNTAKLVSVSLKP